MDSTIRWIQLSDLHFGDESQYSEDSRNSLINFINENNIISEGIDCIFVTGDMIYAKKADDYNKKTLHIQRQLSI